MAFKANESFLRFLTMGAVGCRRVAGHMDAHGHRMVELERYATTNKIWSTKIKRLRLPDLLCLRCGLRVEARGKTKLEIKVSDSPSVPGREWDAGLRDEDVVAIVVCRETDEQVVAANPVFLFTVRALRQTVDQSKLGPPKSAGEGAERDRTWPSSRAKRAGRVTEVDADGVRVEYLDGRRYKFRHTAQKPFAYLKPGDTFGDTDSLVIGAPGLFERVACPGEAWDPYADLSSADATSVYAAVKALGLIRNKHARQQLRRIAQSHEDERVRLEAVASLARLGDLKAVHELYERARDAATDESMAMEATFVLSEIESDEAATALRQVADHSELPEELRAAAVWGLGVGGHERFAAVLPYISDANDVVALHAIVASGRRLGRPVMARLVALLHGSDREAPAATALLVRQGVEGARMLLEAERNEDEPARSWTIYGLGLCGREHVESASGGRLPEDLDSVLAPVWRGLSSWINEERLTLLRYVDRQQLPPLVP